PGVVARPAARIRHPRREARLATARHRCGYTKRRRFGAMTTVSRQNTPDAAASPSFSVVLFDLDDTLFDHQRAVALGVAAQRRAHGGALAAADAAEEMRRWHHLEELHYGRYLHGELTLQEQRRVRVQEFARAHRIELDDHSADQWYAEYL